MNRKNKILFFTLLLISWVFVAIGILTVFIIFAIIGLFYHLFKCIVFVLKKILKFLEEK
jgi:energy-coupling factor transporter transmembrane protein EcfT